MLSQPIKAGTLSQQKQISDFGSVLLVDGGSDGFILEDQEGNTCVIPTGIPIAIGGPGARPSSFLRVNPPTTGTLNCGFLSQDSQGFKFPLLVDSDQITVDSENITIDSTETTVDQT